MAALEDSILVSAPLRRVFDYLADVEHVPEWLPNVVEARRTSEIEAGPGTEVDVVFTAGGRESEGTCRCVEWDAPHRLVLESEIAIGVTSTLQFDLATAGRQTEVLARIEYTLTGGRFGRLMGGLFGDRMVRRDMRTALENLKERVEDEQRRRRRPRRTAPA